MYEIPLNPMVYLEFLSNVYFKIYQWKTSADVLDGNS